ncbi:MAG: alpha/beta hydrolase [Planctomycetota bacterium]|nr:MAG: alpha/beta hydrolase [Planctomycetota bacterium]
MPHARTESLAVLILAFGPATFAQEQPPAFEAGGIVLEELTIPLRDGGEVIVDRGVLYTPIVRANPDSATIEVEFHRFRTTHEGEARPPIFRLHGGPGWPGPGGALQKPGYYEDNVQELAQVADVVLVGQRGIGSSKPNTVCRGPKWAAVDAPTDQAKSDALLAKACEQCKAHWEEQGLDLAGLNVIEAAADVVEIATALGYPKITIMGGSFGSHWGMTIMRYHEDRVARAILSGMEGPDQTYDMPSFVLNSLKRIAAAAEASDELYPYIPEGGLIQAFEQVIAIVAEDPVLVTLGKLEVLLDAPRMRDLALGYTGRTSSRRGARTWPADIIALAAGDYREAAKATAQRNYSFGFPTASFFMLDCGSGISAERLAQLLADPAAEIVGPLGGFYETTCAVWDSDVGDDFRTDFETDIPTVIVHGTWDTSTPFENAVELAPCFTRSKFVVVEGGSHGALGEARRASESFHAALMKFVATGDLEGLPELVELPPLDWAIPGE